VFFYNNIEHIDNIDSIENPKTQKTKHKNTKHVNLNGKICYRKYSKHETEKYKYKTNKNFPNTIR